LNKPAAPPSKVQQQGGFLNLSSIIAKLNHSRSAFLRVAESVPGHRWTAKPSAEEWSAAELVVHLVLVEQGIVVTARRMIEKTPKHFALWKRFHFPMWLVEARVVRRKSPIPLDPSLISAKENMLRQMGQTRQATLQFLEETSGRKLSVYRWKHPFLGNLNLYEWFEMIAAHQVRHTMQLKEIESRLRKVV
jgi:DinB superfamily